MIVFINGPFGVGKTETAKRLQVKIDNSLIFDPESVGELLVKLLGSTDPKADFQEYDLWPIITLDVIGRLRERDNSTLIIPMTLYKIERFKLIAEGIRQIDPDFHHFTLLAGAQLLEDRLTGRGEHKGGWGFNHIEESLEAYNSPVFEKKIITDNLTIDETVEKILEDAHA